MESSFDLYLNSPSLIPTTRLSEMKRIIVRHIVKWNGIHNKKQNKIRPKGKHLASPLLNWGLLWTFSYRQRAKVNGNERGHLMK